MADLFALPGCAEEVSLLSVTRELDFGQFIELFDSTRHPSRADLPTLAEIIMGPSATLALARSDTATALLPATDLHNELAACGGILAPHADREPACSSGPAVHVVDLVDGDLRVAAFVPWKQTWTLKGFSRGELLYTFALAPGEYRSLEVSTWERLTRLLEPSAATDVELRTGIAQTIRDTEDLLKEVMAERGFAWQSAASIDVSYRPAVASIKVDTGDGISETTSVQKIVRDSGQMIEECIRKAIGHTSSRNVTFVTQSAEEGATRFKIANPNRCHTLTLNFFETVAHHEIALQVVKSNLRLVVLLPNPIAHQEFDAALVLRHEFVLRNALLDTALADGFDACQFVAAHGEAATIVHTQRSEAARVGESTGRPHDTAGEVNQDTVTAHDQIAVAFPHEELLRAFERSTVLLRHLTDHRNFYNYMLFQALPLSEQVLRIVEVSGGRLQSGVFEPQIVAMSGTMLVVAVTPSAASTKLQAFLTSLRNAVETAFADPPTTAYTLPTSGLFVSSRLDRCSGCEERLETARNFALVRLE